MNKIAQSLAQWRGVCLSVLLLGGPLLAQDAATAARIKQLEEQNARLQEQLQRQQGLIEALNARFSVISNSTRATEQRLQQLQARQGDSGTSADAEKPENKFGFGNLHLSGTAGAAFFRSGSKGAFPNSEFRIDEAKLFLEAPVAPNIYFFSELNLLTREREITDDYFMLGELYVEFENVAGSRLPDRLLNARIGRMDIPFGEEYLNRDMMDNALVTHSVGDLWGIDEGLELYGSAGKFQYAAAVQNGSVPMFRDFDADKAVALRLGYDPARWVHLSLSGMRTGDINMANDKYSEMWIGNGFFRGLGPAASTTKFHADLIEGDLEFKWRGGHFRAAGGTARFDDDALVSYRRRLYYYYLEARQDLGKKLYAASRFSQMLVAKGYPLVGHGTFGEYFFSPNQTDELWRASFGLGYRPSDRWLIKAEYALEGGSLTNGRHRSHENLLALEIVCKF